MPSDTDAIQRKLREAAVRALNRAARDLYDDSQHEVGRDDGDLARSGDVDEATLDELIATVAYHAPHSAAQHEGHALQKWTKGKRRREWEVHNRPGGGKSNYLSDPLKALAGRFEHYFAEEWAKVLRG